MVTLDRQKPKAKVTVLNTCIYGRYGADQWRCGGRYTTASSPADVLLVLRIVTTNSYGYRSTPYIESLLLITLEGKTHMDGSIRTCLLLDWQQGFRKR